MDTLHTDESFGVDGHLDSANGKVRLVLQSDGNLVLYRNDSGQALWASDTVGSGADRVVMQGDGNAVLYSGAAPHWATGTDGHPGTRLVLQDDGNLVVYGADSAALWASNTVTDWSARTASSGDVHLGTARWMNTTAQLSAGGTITGTTRIWCTWALRGYTGSVAPIVLDAQDRVLWPENVRDVKQQYGVDGTAIPFKPSDRTESWSVNVPTEIMQSGQVHRLALLHFLDGKNRLLEDIKILGEIVGAIIEVIRIIIESMKNGNEAPENGTGIVLT
ncbi:hypothetical protein [Actinomycetospora termitidis]|uniref:Bulb-type lectin domain-containing protein n=1 Tax=Actinomycetospora termitidis TaxID=3053470 RepID=A0ABT7M8R5_9PSEU|nr:hypothetical protein [Actinomycetospora sp. Odt1-22]MDL5156584.1 hypothetical protein [Actinomycetospora sp. Odt1-22]